jgi:hypothetical protein
MNINELYLQMLTLMIPLFLYGLYYLIIVLLKEHKKLKVQK